MVLVLSCPRIYCKSVLHLLNPNSIEVKYAFVVFGVRGSSVFTPYLFFAHSAYKTEIDPFEVNSYVF